MAIIKPLAEFGIKFDEPKNFIRDVESNLMSLFFLFRFSNDLYFRYRIIPDNSIDDHEKRLILREFASIGIGFSEIREDSYKAYVYSPYLKCLAEVKINKKNRKTKYLLF